MPFNQLNVINVRKNKSFKSTTVEDLKDCDKKNKNTLSINVLIDEIKKLSEENELLKCKNKSSSGICLVIEKEKDVIEKERNILKKELADTMKQFEEMKNYYEDYIDNVLKGQQQKLEQIKLNTDEKNKLYDELEKKKKILEKELEKKKKIKKIPKRIEELAKPKGKI